MGKCSKFIIVFLFLSFIGLNEGNAQKGYELGGHLGISHYFGDLNTSYRLSDPGFAFGIKGRRNFNERLSLAIALDYGRISASDANSNNNFERQRNLDFFSQIFDLSTVLEFNFFPYFHGSSEEYYTPYLFGGISFMKFNPKSELDGVTYDLRDLGTEGQFIGNEYGLVSAAFVFGIGFKWDINRDWSFNVQLSGRNIASDYIDDVSLRYPEFASLEIQRGQEAVRLSNRSPDPDFAVPNMQRGNGKSNDVVYFLNIGIMKYFGQLECPPISKIKKK